MDFSSTDLIEDYSTANAHKNNSRHGMQPRTVLPPYAASDFDTLSDIGSFEKP
jgi:hypothetical protein